MNMPVMLLSLVVSLNIFASTDCAQSEAQFIGIATGLSSYEDQYAQSGFCSFSIEIKPENYRPSGVCPLDYTEAVQAVFDFDLRNTSCPVSYTGQQISGYLVKKNGVISIE